MADFFNDLLSGIGVPTPTLLPFPGADETTSPLSTLSPQPTSVDLDERPTITPTSSDSPSSTPSRPADDDAADETSIPGLTASSELPLPTSLTTSETGISSDLPSAITRPPTTLLSSIRAGPSASTSSEEELIVAPPQPTTLVVAAPTTTLPLAIPPPASTSSLAPLPTAEEANTGSSGSGALMPALPISLGLVAGVLTIGGLIGWAYRKGKGPFAGRARRRAMMEKEDMEDGEIDRQQRQKWDPRVSRMGGHAVNF
ncbi:hypothetical protein D7B24_005553 [Verticillium nonalfalfae]|uniref:Uncharacterized protein n=1 Tax=Verticillium nonalfalfae TaxID=1051616 RepID=A0A3M9YF67_9PEZI|nr:uncharacterized protein D7B24_005553 [Verticillium nonalfalfae]RNJ57760.1 hypothetical protein D7B24_005553 [Verticillium nonalfalfae]